MGEEYQFLTHMNFTNEEIHMLKLVDVTTLQDLQ